MSTWGEARNVLAIRLDQMGDVLMTTPALHALRTQASGRRVALLTSPSGAALAPLLSDVDEVIVYEAPWMKSTDERPDPIPDLALIDRLRAANFDAAAVFNVCTQSSMPAVMLAYLAGIPLRAAYFREKPYGLLTDGIPDPDVVGSPTLRHEVRRQLDLVAAVGAVTDDERMRIDIQTNAIARAWSTLAAHGIDPAERDWALIHPGSTAASRRYLPESYGIAAAALARHHGWRVVVTGGQSERELVDRVASVAPEVVRLDHEMELGDLAALISLAPVLIANNSGPAHVAAAVGTPVVSLYALTNPQHTPWAVPTRVLNRDVPCRNCLRSVCPMGHHMCLRGVAPEQIVEAALELNPAGRHSGRSARRQLDVVDRVPLTV
jgi:lipopolysaccharide heptosyltransferase II